jgi:hypothetical protein
VRAVAPAGSPPVPPPRLGWSNLAVVVTVLVASVSYSASVTTHGLVLFVLPGALVGALAALWMADRSMNVYAVGAAGLLAALAWATLANSISGETSGPVARSTFVASACAALALTAPISRFPVTFLLPVVGTVVGALVLGAGGQVVAVSVITAVLSVISVAWLESARRRWVEPPRRAGLLPVLALLLGAAALAAVVLQTGGLGGSPFTEGAIPPVTSPTSTPTTTPTATPTPTESATTNPAVTEKQNKHLGRALIIVLLILLAGLLILLIALAARVVYVAVAWRRLRARLQSGPPEAAIGGAWVWAQTRLAVYGVLLPASTPVDVISRDASSLALPEAVREPMAALAELTVRAIFNADSETTGGEALDAWALAEAAPRGARPGVTRVRLAQRWLRGPSAFVGGVRGRGSDLARSPAG